MDANIIEIEALAGQMAKLLAQGESPQTTEQAQVYARALAIVQASVVEPLATGMAEFTLANGPVYIDSSGDAAYGHWEKKTTTVSEENELWAFLAERGINPENHKRPNLVTLKALVNGEEKPDGIERFIGSDSSMVFGFKKNLIKKPKSAANEQASVVMNKKTGLRTVSGPMGSANKAKVVSITPGPLPEREVVAGCGVMPPARVMAKV